MDKQEQIPWEELAKYFAGELTREEQQHMKNWIESDPAREDKIEQLYSIWKESEVLPYNLDTDRSWNRLLLSIEEIDNQAAKHIRMRKKERTLLRLYSSRNVKKAGLVVRRVAIIAAAVLIIATAGLFVLQYQSATESVIAEDQNRVITTRNGERASYLLSDGSRVVLHAGSRLEIPETYNTEKRELYLQGEAYFETVHNPDKPFIVHSGHSYTRVVGTQFLVQAWPDAAEKNIEVVVSEGQVLFGDRRISESDGFLKEVLLTENQRGVLTGYNGPVIKEVTDMAWYLGWIEGRLVFENRELRDVLPRLERWVDISIEIADELISTEKITAEIDYSLPMSDVLNGIAMSLDLQVVRTGSRSYEFSQ